MPVLRPLLRPLVDSLSYPYREWISAEATLTAKDRAAIAAHVAALDGKPLISVVMPVYNPPEAFLRAAIASVEAQLWPHWQLCIADDASPAPHVAVVLAEAAARDPRIQVLRRPVNGHISAASNSALSLATGDWVVLMDHDDVLPETALYEIAAEVAAHPDAAVIYSDEDHVDSKGSHSHPYFKPDFDPDLLLAQNLISHLGAYRRDLLTEIGGFREGFEGSQDHDLALRATRRCGAARVRHIPAVLYHWRQQAGVASFSESQMERCVQASARAVAEHLAESGVAGARIERVPLAPIYNRVVFPLPPDPPLVSVIIPTRDRAELVEACIAGLLQRTDYADLEIIIADNDSVEPATRALFDRLRQDPRISIVAIPGPFNYSRLNNLAVAQSRGGVLLLLNNDIDVIGPGWLRELVSHAVRPEVGAVGARLLYGDGRVQHCGDVLGFPSPDGIAGHFGRFASPDVPGPHASFILTRSVSAVTAACLALRRDVFDEVGGFDEKNLAVAFNDVDLCLRIREAGYRTVFAPAAELYHLESASRGDDMRPDQRARFLAEVAWMRQRWGAALDADPYWNPNLSLAALDGRFAFPSRRPKPWRAYAAPARGPAPQTGPSA